MGGTRGGSEIRVLVLGAGREQTGILTAARGRDLFVIACERDPHAPGFKLADRRAIFSRVDEVEAGRLAIAEGVNAVAATGSDPTLPIASRLSERLGLPVVHPVEVATRLSSREIQRDVLAQAGLQRSGPLETEHGDRVVTALLIEGCFFPLAVTERRALQPSAWFRGSAHVCPCDDADDAWLGAARRATEVLDVRDGTVRIDLLLADDGPEVLSVRPGCTGEPEEVLCSQAHGVDLPDLVLGAFLGERIRRPSPRLARGFHACVRLSIEQSKLASSPTEECLGFARAETRVAALEGAMNAALRVRFRGAETLPSLR